MSELVTIYHHKGDTHVRTLAFRLGIQVQCAHKTELQTTPCPIALAAGTTLEWRSIDSSCIQYHTLQQPLAVGDRLIPLPPGLRVPVGAVALVADAEYNGATWVADVRSTMESPVLFQLSASYSQGFLRLDCDRNIPTAPNLRRTQVGDERGAKPYYWRVVKTQGTQTETVTAGDYWLIG